jgi:hypothetical protein
MYLPLEQRWRTAGDSAHGESSSILAALLGVSRVCLPACLHLVLEQRTPQAGGGEWPSARLSCLTSQMQCAASVTSARTAFLCSILLQARCFACLCSPTSPASQHVWFFRFALPAPLIALSLQLLSACLSVLPHLVRLLAAADAAAAGAGVSHAATPAAATAVGTAGYRALLGLGGEAGDSRYLQQVPLVLAQLMDGR